MIYLEKVFSTIHLFAHLSDEERSGLVKITRTVTVNSGQFFDLKKNNSLNIVLSGIFEIEALGKTDIVYLSAGSFFGNLPFTENRQRGRVKALSDSTLALIDSDDLLKFFLLSYKGLRGFIAIIKKLGFEISGYGAALAEKKTKVTAVYSRERGSGKTFFSSLLARSLSEGDRAIVLDLSYGGTSVFTYFEQKILPPLSQRELDGDSAESVILNRVVDVDSRLSLVNITHDSRIRIDPNILSPVLYLLSKNYKYIILDVSDDDPDLRKAAFGLSDKIFVLASKRSALMPNMDQIASEAAGGQRIYYVLNEFFSSVSGELTGMKTLKKFDFKHERDGAEGVERLSSDECVADFSRTVSGKSRACVLEARLAESVYFAGFLNAAHGLGFNFDIIYSSAFSHIISAFHIISDSESEYAKLIKKFLSGERINKYLTLSFPDESIFLNTGIRKFMEEVFANSRMEMFKNVAYALLSKKGFSSRRVFSAGYLKDTASASFCLHPAFNDLMIGGEVYNSGLPEYRPAAGDLLRTDVDEIFYVSVANSELMTLRNAKILKFYRTIFDSAGSDSGQDKKSILADRNILLEVSERDLKIDRMIKISQDISAKIIKSIQGDK